MTDDHVRSMPGPTRTLFDTKQSLLPPPPSPPPLQEDAELKLVISDGHEPFTPAPASWNTTELNKAKLINKPTSASPSRLIFLEVQVLPEDILQKNLSGTNNKEVLKA